MRTLLVLVPLAMSTSGCLTGSSEAPSPAVCPQITEYPLEMQRAAQQELARLPADGVIRTRFMPDYGTMRDEVRACRKATK